MQKQQLVEELHKPARKNFKRRHVIVKGINDLWQADLVEMGNYSSFNKNYKYLLTVIDTFSQYAWAHPVKTKNAVDVTKAMDNIFNTTQSSPTNLQTDLGKEFYNTQFNQLMKKYNVNHYSTYSILKASIVERFNRTLKEMMWKEFSMNGSYKWIDNVKVLVAKYNNSIHRTIKMRPKDVNKNNEKLLLKTVYNNLKIFHKPKYKVGDKVRISKYKHIFEKGYTPNWTTEIFTITKVQNTNPITYLLEDYKGQPIEGGFYEKEIIKTKHPDLYLVEKILRKKGRKVFVKWLGFNNQHNSWIDEKELLKK